MSKIVCWSPLQGQYQTSNLHITGLIMSLHHKKKVLMMQTQFSMNNFEGPLIGKRADAFNKKDETIFQDIGLDAAVMYSRMNMLIGDTLERCCMTFPDTSLLLLPGTETRNEETFNRDIGSSVYDMIGQAEEGVDIVMIDINSGNDDLSLRLMSSADLIIINLTQDRYVLNRFFSEYGERLAGNKNVFYLFGNYDKNSGYNIINCRRKYRKYINKDNSGVIPHCTKYMDAQNECKILGMIKEGLHFNKRTGKGNFKLKRYSSEETDYFFYQASRSVMKILNILSLNVSTTPAERSGA